MAWFEDLAPCNYFRPEWSSFLRSIGWLERGKSFPTGLVERKVYDKLLELWNSPWSPLYSMGPHRCDLCYYEGEYGTTNLFIPGEGFIFVCPQLIVHYMNAHGYRPPEEFCQAVLLCPPMKSMDYLKGILANGGRPMVADSKVER